MKRRDFLQLTGLTAAALTVTSIPGCSRKTVAKPNILFCISDDQTWLHSSAYGSRFVKTPAFDRLASEGVLFNNAFVSVPSCNPSRSSVLTGLPFYRLKEASMNHTVWPQGLTVYTDLLEKAGFLVGYTGKGCMPTNWKAADLFRNPAGTAYNNKTFENGSRGMLGTSNDYAGNFEEFLNQRTEGQSFCFR